MSSTRIHKPIRLYTSGLTEHASGSRDIPYGRYKYNSALDYLPGGLFHFVKDGDLYVPTLHGLSAECVTTLKNVAVAGTNSSMANRPFLNAPHMYEVELINTGREPLKQGDRFTVQLPNGEDVKAQSEVRAEPGNNISVNKGIWGGLLATRRVDDNGGDALEEALRAIREEDGVDVSKWLSPHTPESLYAMMSLVANGAGYSAIPLPVRQNAAAVITSAYNPHTFDGVVANDEVKRYIRHIVMHSLTILEGVQGFASGQVIRACNGYTTSNIYTGDRFMAQLNVNRWLS